MRVLQLIGRFQKYLQFVVRDRERLEYWIGLYIHHRNLYNKGQGELGFFKTLVNVPSLMMFWLFVRSLVPEFPFWLFISSVPVLMGIKIISNWVVGWWWDKHDFYDRESDWGNNRNPIQKAISETLLNGKGL